MSDKGVDEKWAETLDIISDVGGRLHDHNGSSVMVALAILVAWGIETQRDEGVATAEEALELHMKAVRSFMKNAKDTMARRH